MASKHGHARKTGAGRASEYNTWLAMKQRCENPSNASYHRYGGRGIRICAQWLGEEGYATFIADMGRRPPGGSIERINNDLGYSPDNCRWATRTEQQRNRDAVVNVTMNGKTQCVTAWAEELGIKVQTVRKRMNTYKWDAIKALTEPLVYGGRSKPVEFEGEATSLSELSARSGLPLTVIRDRLRLGWSLKDAITKPQRRKLK